MAYKSHHHGFRSHGVLRLLVVLVGVCLVGFILGPPLYWHFKENLAAQASCPQCVCDCSSEAFFSIPLDCGKHDPDMNKEMEKDKIDLLSEELNLLRNVSNDSMEHTKASILEAKKTSSQYQKEAEKCNAGVETCEEAREKVEAALIAERKLSILWEKRAHEHGWIEQRRVAS